MKTFIKLLTILILNLGVFYQNALGSDIIKIGLIVPLSGEYSEIGNSIIKSENVNYFWDRYDSGFMKIIYLTFCITVSPSLSLFQKFWMFWKVQG